MHFLISIILFSFASLALAEVRSEENAALPALLNVSFVPEHTANALKEIKKAEDICLKKFTDSKIKAEKTKVLQQRTRCQEDATKVWRAAQARVVRMPAFATADASTKKIGELIFYFNEEMDLTRISAQSLGGKEVTFVIDSETWQTQDPSAPARFTYVAGEKNGWVELLPRVFGKSAWVPWSDVLGAAPEITKLDSTIGPLYSFPALKVAVIGRKMKNFDGKKKYQITGQTTVSLLVRELEKANVPNKEPVEYGIPFRLLIKPDGSANAEIAGDVGC